MKRGLPLAIIRFDTKYEPFCVSNGVIQGSFLSPFLFAVYLDGLLVYRIE